MSLSMSDKTELLRQAEAIALDVRSKLTACYHAHCKEYQRRKCR